jgi:hypothetical protein
MEPTALLPLRRKLCYGFLSPLKIHWPRPGLNPQTLGPVASTCSVSTAIKRFWETDRRFTLKWIPLFLILKFVAVLSVRINHDDRQVTVLSSVSTVGLKRLLLLVGKKLCFLLPWMTTPPSITAPITVRCCQFDKHILAEGVAIDYPLGYTVQRLRLWHHSNSVMTN